MRTKNLALWVFLAFLLGACGSEGNGDDKAECGNGVEEKGEECDDGHEACEKCRVKEGWEKIAPGEYVRVEICDNGIDDDDNELVDCEDPYCETHSACVTDCSSQAQCGDDPRAVQVCMDGICRMAVTFDGEGKVLVGEVGIMNQFDIRRTKLSSIKSYTVEYFHPAIPGSSSPLTCETLATQAREATLVPSKYNVIRTIHNAFTQSSGDTFLIRDSGVPATSDVGWVTLTRFFEGNREAQSGVPTGRMLAFSCVPELQVFPGSTWDPSRQEVVDVSPTCSSDSDCADGWECITSTGLCAYRQCEPSCPQGTTCRQLASGDAQCLVKCHPTLPCESGYRCDSTPGWEPACFPF